jgi:chemotaxis protein CheX
MKTEWINPFVESVYSLCGTMLSCGVQRGQLGLANADTVAGGDITALIGLSGMARGMVALSFPLQTARAMVGRLLSLSQAELDESVSDGVAELVNIVAGSAKAKFSNGNGPEIINLGLPTVIHAGSQVIRYPSQSSWLDVPFSSDLGPFSLRITFELEASKGGNR